ncbi:MAG: hypothetical protein V2I33_18215, partial [Kangiellaceae bacterium]|nr:hypothetical protein [Kangiellaceae bacterium]
MKSTVYGVPTGKFGSQLRQSSVNSCKRGLLSPNFFGSGVQRITDADTECALLPKLQIGFMFSGSNDHSSNRTTTRVFPDVGPISGSILLIVTYENAHAKIPKMLI